MGHITGPQGGTLSFASSEKVMPMVSQIPLFVFFFLGGGQLRQSLAVACRGVGLNHKWTGLRPVRFLAGRCHRERDPLASGLVNLSPRLVRFLGEGSFTVPSSQSWVLSGGEGWGGEISAPAFVVRGLLTPRVSSVTLVPLAGFLGPQTALPALGRKKQH